MAVINNLISLMKRTTDPQQLEELDQQRIAFSDKAARLIDGVLDTTTTQYQGQSKVSNRRPRPFSRQSGGWKR